MACDLLQGLDIEALSPPGDAPRYALHLPNGVGGATLLQLLPPEESPLTGRLRRCPSLRSNRHWARPQASQLLRRIAAGGPIDADLGLAAAAVEDFRHVWQAKLDGRLKAENRFIVALPTAYTLLCGLGQASPDGATLERVERSLAAEVRRLLESLPPEQIAIQWDVCGETRIWESRGRDLGAPRDLPERLLKSFIALSDAVPPAVELGWHFCHRDTAGAASSSAHDAAQVTRLAGAIIASTDREPGFLHLPVPRERDDPDYYAPLANLGLWPAMDVYLGLVHEGDDVESAWRRLYAASGVLGRVGIAPACGTDPALVLDVLGELLARAVAEVPAAE
jgi:hypothetical protein